MVYYIGFAHLLGCVFIVLGLFIRISIFVQLPALLAELYYLVFLDTVLGTGSVMIFILLLVFLIQLFARRADKSSMDYYRKRQVI